MRYTGTVARGIRLPIIKQGDDLAEIVAECLVCAAKTEGFNLRENDVIGVTEAILGKAQKNYATLDQIAEDVKRKFPNGEVGVVFPMLSRNRFLHILKGIARGADKVYVLLAYPMDEVGNPLIDIRRLDEISDALDKVEAKPIPVERFIKEAGEYKHPFTEIDYVEMFRSVSDNIEVFVSGDPRDILRLTPYVLAAEIHTRHYTKERLEKAGAKSVFMLSDILAKPISGSGFNPDYGVLGSNISNDETLKLFPRDCEEFVEALQNKIKSRTGICPEVLVYADGAFKDPKHGIWELADPVVSPGHSKRLGGKPNEIKLKWVVNQELTDLSDDEKEEALKAIIREKNATGKNEFDTGTTPRIYADLLGSLCDLMGGSGDKGTPVVLIQGYFDDFATQ